MLKVISWYKFKQIEGMKIANSKGEFVWEEFIYPNQPFQFLGQLDIDGSTSKASIWVHDWKFY